MDWQTSLLPCYSQYCQDSILHLHLSLSSRPTLKSLIMVTWETQANQYWENVCLCVTCDLELHLGEDPLANHCWEVWFWPIVQEKLQKDRWMSDASPWHELISPSAEWALESWSYCLVFMVNSLVLLALQRRSGSVSCTRTFWDVDRKSRDQPLTFRLVEVPLYHPSQSCSMRLWNLWKNSLFKH